MNTPPIRIIDGYSFIQYQHSGYSEDEMISRSFDFFNSMDRRRSVRDFSGRPVPLEIIHNLLKTASSAPSGAHKQPWTFCVVSDPEIKKRIRAEAEKEEYESYNGRMSKEWLEDLKPLQTDWTKPFLETAPYLIIVFKKVYDLNSVGSKRNNYYVTELLALPVASCSRLSTRRD
jgi:iodotyrosine deiodinase